MHFGLYLKNKGIISAEQLVGALEAQLQSLVPIGQLALEEGLLSPRDIFEILRAQCDSPGELFGELAIGMGMLDREQLMRLLLIQTERKRPIGEILVKQGVLSARHAAAELAAYRRSLTQPRRAAPAKVVPPPRGRAARLASDRVTAV